MRAESLASVVASLLDERTDNPTGRCECRGECGGQHAGGVCDAEPPVRLRIAPRDAGVSLTRASALPADELMLWCHACRDAAEATDRRRRRERLAAEADTTQLDLWGAA